MTPFTLWSGRQGIERPTAKAAISGATVRSSRRAVTSQGTAVPILGGATQGTTKVSPVAAAQGTVRRGRGAKKVQGRRKNSA